MGRNQTARKSPKKALNPRPVRAVFFDAGNTFGDPWGNGAIDPTELRFAYGFGVRWFSPIGPLRFEYGFPIAPLPDERKAVFDFTIGSAF